MRAESARVMRDRWLKALRWLHRESAHHRTWKLAKKLLKKESATYRVALRRLITSEVLNTTMSPTVAHDSLVAALAAPGDIAAEAEADAAAAAAGEDDFDDDDDDDNDDLIVNFATETAAAAAAAAAAAEEEEDARREKEDVKATHACEVEMTTSEVLNPMQRLRQSMLSSSTGAASAAAPVVVVTPHTTHIPQKPQPSRL